MEKRILIALLCLLAVTACGDSGGTQPIETPDQSETSGFVWDNSAWNEKNWQ